MKKKLNNIGLILLMGLFFVSCDFTSGLHKDILKAQNLLSNQKFDKAISIYEDILSRKISKNIQVKVNFQLGDVYSLYLNQYERSITYFSQVYKITDDPLWQVKANEKIGQIYFDNLNKFDKSAEFFKLLKDFKPQLQKHDFYEFQYILSLFKLNKYRNSIEEFKKISKEPAHKFRAKSYYYLGMSYYFQKQWMKAINSYFEYIKIEKRKDLVVQAKFMIANAYESAEQLKKAYNIYYSILGEYPNPDVIKNRLESLYNRRVARKR